MMNWKEFGRKQSWHNFKTLSQHLLGGTEENHKNLTEDSRLPGPRFEPGTSGKRSRSVTHSTTTFGLWSSGLWHCIVLYCRLIPHVEGPCLASFFISTLKMEAVHFTRMLVTTYETTLHHNRQYSTLHFHCCVNPRCQIYFLFNIILKCRHTTRKAEMFWWAVLAADAAVLVSRAPQASSSWLCATVIAVHQD
jgi:hypothetical protein